MEISSKMFDKCMRIVLWLGFRTSAGKVAKPSPKNIVLGVELDCANVAIRCGTERAANLLTMLQALETSPETFEFKQLESLVGKLGFIAFKSRDGPHRMVPLYALKWLSKDMRVAAVSGELKTKLGASVRAALKWWKDLLSGSRLLWSADQEPLNWIVLNSDAANDAYGAINSRRKMSFGQFK